MNKPIDLTDVVLVTPRLTLRPWRQTDVEDFYQYASVDGVGQMAGWMPHASREESQTILNLFMQGKHTFALEYQGKVIGSIGVDEYDTEDCPEWDELQGRQLGYVLAKPYWGQGLMPEAVKAVLDYLFDEQQLDFVSISHFEWNTQSRRVIEKCGFTYLKDKVIKTRRGTKEPGRFYRIMRSER